jgi:putative nucleotidyltransferase with HDIG domain
MISKIRIIFVDDDLCIISSMRRTTKLLRPEWETLCAQDGKTALELQNTSPADVIVSDIMMPGMDGTVLLGLIRDRWPETIRIALSGQVGLEQVMRSIQGVHQYISKPCDGEMLISKIELAIHCRSILLAPALQKMVAQIDTLPMLPRIHQQLTDEFSTPEPSVKKIATLITRDMALMAKVLSLINSPYFALSRKIESVEQAISLLGLDTLRALVLSSHLFLKYEGLGVPDMSLQLLSDHCYRVTVICRKLVALANVSQKVGSRCYMAAMLHDIGKLVIAAAFPDKFNDILMLIKHEHLTLYNAELTVFGSTHAELGAYLLALWGLEQEVVMAIGQHHSYKEFDMSEAMLLHVANVIDHNCVQLKPKRAICKLSAQLVKTQEQEELLNTWVLRVHDQWGDMQSIAPFTPVDLTGKNREFTD